MKMRKFLAMLLTLSLVLSLAAPMALATGENGGDDANVTNSTDDNQSSNDESSESTGPSEPAGGNETTTTPPTTDDEEKPPVNPDKGDEEKPPVNPDKGDEEKPPVNPDEGDEEKPPVNPDEGGEEKPPVNPDEGGEEKPPVNPDEGGEEKPPVNPGEGGTEQQPGTGEGTGEGGNGTGDINVPGTNPGDGEDGETEEPRYDDEGYQIDENGNRVLDEDGNPIKKPLNPGEIIEQPETPPELTEEEKAALEELGGKADAVTGETSREDLEAIKNSPLYDRLTDAQKKAVEDALAALEQPPVLPEISAEELYTRLMNAQTWEEYEAIQDSYSDEDWDVFFYSLDEDSQNALIAYRGTLLLIAYPIAGYTRQSQQTPSRSPAPSPKRSMSKARSAAFGGRAVQYSEEYMDTAPSDPDNYDTGLKTSKRLDGTTLSIEAWSTGTSSTSTTPSVGDIYLIIDRSGEMLSHWEMDDGTTREYAMEQGVELLLNCIARDGRSIKYIPASAGNSAPPPKSYTMEDSKDVSGFISMLQAEGEKVTGASHPAAALEQAKEDIARTGSTNSAVIVFQAGFPGSNNGVIRFNVPKGNDTVISAQAIKNHGAQIYVIGSYAGADDQYTGEDWLKSSDNKAEERYQIASANHMMQLISSNNKTVGQYGQSLPSDYDFNGPYFKTPANLDEVKDAFEDISETITASDVPYDENTIVKDVITPYFKVDGDVNTDGQTGAVRVYTTAPDGSDKTLYSGAHVEYDPATKEIKVTGFDFGDPANAVKTDSSTSETSGKKLLIEIDIVRENEFWGGNDVPTNISNESGVIYEDNFVQGLNTGTEENPAYESPKTDVTLLNVQLKPRIVNIYYGNSELGVDDLHQGDSIKVQYADGSWNDVDYNNLSWQTDYAKLSKTAELDPSGQEISNTQDGAYTVSRAVEPIKSGSIQKGKATFAKGETAKVNVFLPTITFADMRTYLTVDPHAEEHTPYSVAWKHNGNVVTAPETENSTIQTSETDATLLANQTMEGKEPELTFNIAGRVKTLYGEDKNHIVRDYYALVNSVSFNGGEPVRHRDTDGPNKGKRNDITTTVLQGDKEVEVNVLTFAHHECDDIVSNDFDSTLATGEFLVHVFKPRITFKDIYTYKGTEKSSVSDTDYAKALVSEEWYYPGTIKPNKTLAMPDPSLKPDIKCEYQPRQERTAAEAEKGRGNEYILRTGEGSYNGKHFFEQDTLVRVQVKICKGENTVTEYTPAGWTASHNINDCVNFIWEKDSCPVKCNQKDDPKDFPNCIGVKGYQFYVHVKTCDLTVTKVINKAGKEYDASNDTFVFTVNGSGNPLADEIKNLKVHITGAGSKLIGRLPVGVYSVEEQAGWAWRYDTDTEVHNVSLSSTHPSDTTSAVITNVLKTDKWLSYEHAEENDYALLEPHEVPGSLDDKRTNEETPEENTAGNEDDGNSEEP